MLLIEIQKENKISQRPQKKNLENSNLSNIYGCRASNLELFSWAGLYKFRFFLIIYHVEKAATLSFSIQEQWTEFKHPLVGNVMPLLNVCIIRPNILPKFQVPKLNDSWCIVMAINTFDLGYFFPKMKYHSLFRSKFVSLFLKVHLKYVTCCEYFCY